MIEEALLGALGSSPALLLLAVGNYYQWRRNKELADDLKEANKRHLDFTEQLTRDAMNLSSDDE